MTKSRKTAFLLAAILILAAGLRLVNVGVEPFWGDEILSLDIATSFEDTATMTRYLSEVEFHPPLWYWMLRPWTALFGDGEAAARALSVIFGTATVAVVWVLGRRVFGEREGLIAASIIAVMPVMVEFGQEARPYAVLVFLAATAMLGLWERLAGGKARWLALYVCASAAMLYLHYSAVFFLGAAGAWWLIAIFRDKKDRRKILREAVIAHGAMFLLYYPWLDSFLYKLDLGRFRIYGLDREVPDLRATPFFETVLTKLFWPVSDRLVPRALAVAESAFKFVLVASLWTVHRRSARSGRSGSSSAVHFLAVFVALPLVLFLFSPQAVPYSDQYQRHVLFAVVPIALLVARVLSLLKPRETAAALAVLFISFIPALSLVLDDDSKYHGDYGYRTDGGYIAEHAKDGDMVVVSVVTVRSNLQRYLPDGMPVFSMTPYPDYGLDVWKTKRTLGLMENESQVRLISSVMTGAKALGSDPESEEIAEKLDRLTEIHRPKRVWLYAFVPGNSAHDWFRERGWRHAIRSIAGVFRVDLYEAP